MKRRALALGAVFALWALLFFLGMNQLEGDRWAQAAVTAAYVLGVVLLTRWGNGRLIRGR